MKFFYLFMILCVVIFLPASNSFAENYFEGKIVGINCISGKMDCNSDMYKYAHISFEPDFVLQVDEQKHYMLEGIPRSMKLRMAGSMAYINGSLIKNGTTITVSKMEMDVDNKRVVCWDSEIKNSISKNNIEKDWIKSLQEEMSLYGH